MSLKLKFKNRKLERRAIDITKFIFEYLGSLNMTPMYKEMNHYEHRRDIRNVVIAKIAEQITEGGSKS